MGNLGENRGICESFNISLRYLSNAHQTASFAGIISPYFVYFDYVGTAPLLGRFGGKVWEILRFSRFFSSDLQNVHRAASFEVLHGHIAHILVVGVCDYVPQNWACPPSWISVLVRLWIRSVTRYLDSAHQLLSETVVKPNSLTKVEFPT